MFAAVLDTCALWPSLQRDVLLSWAAEGLYRPLWSSAILAELEFHETDKLVRLGKSLAEAGQRARRLVEAMAGAFDDATVVGWEPLDGSYGLPDPDDEHLVAAAVVGGAGAIVSDNARDLPQERIPVGIQIRSPREFASDCVSLAPAIALRGVRTMAGRYVAPLRTVEDVLGHLETKNGWNDAVEQLRAAQAVDEVTE